MKFVSKEALSSHIIATILNSTQHLGRDFVTSFRPELKILKWINDRKKQILLSF